ncbi:MAG: hypothetical protein WCC92_20075 [Candidatus Korobacteraceae bacterium]
MKSTVKICCRLLALVTILFFGSMLMAGELEVLPVTDACAGSPYNQTFPPIGDRYQPSIGPGAVIAEERCTMQFSLGLIPAGQKIDSASFVLTCAGGRGDDAGVVAYGYVATGRIKAPDNFTDEANRIAGPSGDRCPFITPQDITAFVSNAYKGGATNVGITLAVTKNAMRAYYSRDHDGNQPKLVVKYSKANEPEE